MRVVRPILHGVEQSVLVKVHRGICLLADVGLRMRTIAPPTSADFLGDTCREKSFADGVNECGVFDAVRVRRENLLPALKLGLCLFALKAGRNAAECGRIERERERQVVAHGNELQQQIHQILIACAG